MAVKQIDFDDLPEDDFEASEKMVNITVKVSESTRDMFQKIAHRERRNMMGLGSLIVEDYINKYIESYEKKVSDSK